MAHNCNCNKPLPVCSPLQRRLFIFSFDETVTKSSTNSVVADMLPASYQPAPIPADQLEQRLCYFNQLYYVLATYCGMTGSKLRHLMERLPEMPGMTPFIRNVSRLTNCELLLISHSNRILVDYWLQGHSIADCFHHIVTYPAHFATNGALVVEPLHQQTSCKLCASSMCKGRIVDEFLADRKLKLGQNYAQVIFIGNGIEDVCPAMRLQEGDMVCARRGCAMLKTMERYRKQHALPIKLLLWNDGHDLEAKLRQRLTALLKKDKVQK